MKNNYTNIIIIFLLIMLYSISNAQWTQTNGPYGGDIHCLAYNGQTLFAGTNSGLYTSVDKGKNWTACAIGIPTNGNQAPNMIIHDIHTNGNVVIALTNWGFYFTTDNGISWNSIGGSILLYHNPGSIFNLKNKLLVYQDVNGGLNITSLTDDLKTANLIGWYIFNSKDTTAQTITFSGNYIFMGTNEGIYSTLDSGKTWTIQNAGLTGKNITSIISKDNILFAGTDSNGIFRSTNNGTNWEQVLSVFNSNLINAFGVNNNTIYVGTNGKGIFYSDDNGTNWTPLNSGLSNAFITSITFVENIPIAGTAGSGVFSFDGSWSSINSGLLATEINTFASIGDTLFGAVEGGGVFFSTDEGTNWNQINNGLTNLKVKALVAKGKNLYAGTFGDGIFRSKNNGLDWDEVNSGITQKYIQSLVVSKNNLIAGTALPPTAPNILTTSWADSGIIFLSTNDGISWNNSYSGLYDVRSLATIDGNVFAAGKIATFHSDGDFTNWTWLDNDTSGDYSYYEAWRWSHYVTSLGVNENNLYAGTQGYGIFLSTDYGNNWTDVSTIKNKSLNKALYEVSSFASFNNNVFVALIGYNQGIHINNGIYLFSSEDGNWIEKDSGFLSDYIGQREPVCVSLFVHNNYLFAGTNGFGVWKVSISDITGINNEFKTIPYKYVLYQNYPNPFNPSTKIKYSIPTSLNLTQGGTLVQLKIFDILGREIKNLVNKKELPGNYEVTFNASNLPSGIYFYRLQAGSFSDTKKLVLLK